MDPRLDRAQGPTIGFAFGHVLATDAMGENGNEAASLGERILALLKLQNSAEAPSFPSMKLPSHRLAHLLVHAAQAGLHTSIGGRQAFADAVWRNCEDVEPHHREFQAATLVAAAVSIGIDSPNLRVEDTLARAIDVAASLEARGEWSPEPDVVAATRRAMNIVSDMNASAESPLERLVEQIGAGDSLSQIVPMAFALASRYQDRRTLTAPLRLGAHTNTILSTVGIIIGAVRGADFLRAYGARAVEEALPFKLKEGTQGALVQRIPYPDDLLGIDGASPPIAPSGPSSFEDAGSSHRTRQRYFPSPHTYRSKRSATTLSLDASFSSVSSLQTISCTGTSTQNSGNTCGHRTASGQQEVLSGLWRQLAIWALRSSHCARSGRGQTHESSRRLCNV